MTSYCIKGKRIMKLKISKEFDINKIQIGILVTGDETQKVGLSKTGDTVLPSGKFGSQSKKNAYGYEYADKTKPKERRYVSTNWIYPFGNTNASMVAVDIYKECYPKIVVSPYGIELELIENEKKQQFVIAELNENIRENYLKEVINLFLEIYGMCYVFAGDIKIDDSLKRQKCNWEILPKGQMPSMHLKQQLRESGEKTDTYNIYRLEYIEKYKPEKVVEGINGFKGYYAYVFDECCVLESAVYGNARYVIPKEEWEILSQKTKKELLDENKVIAKMEHTGKWQQNVRNKFETLGMRH